MTPPPALTSTLVARAIVAAARFHKLQPEVVFSGETPPVLQARTLAAAALKARGIPATALYKAFRLAPPCLSPSQSRMKKISTEDLLTIDAEVFPDGGGSFRAPPAPPPPPARSVPIDVAGVEEDKAQLAERQAAPKAAPPSPACDEPERPRRATFIAPVRPLAAAPALPTPPPEAFEPNRPGEPPSYLKFARQFLAAGWSKREVSHLFDREVTDLNEDLAQWIS